MSETCRSCFARVIWVKTAEGKRMPLDAAPEKRFVLSEEAGEMTARVQAVYTSHFATCPQADRWRKKG